MEESKKAIRYVGVKETVMYGIANAGQVFGYNLVAGGFLSYFFVTVFGIDSRAVSFMILVCGIWDTINDPVMGSLIDKTRTRYGKLRPYLLLVPIPISIMTALLFSGPLLLQDVKSAAVKIVYMYLSYIIWEFFYTIGDVSFWGMSSAISPSPGDRSRVITSARIISSVIGGLSTVILPVLIDASNNHAIGWNLKQVFCFMGVVAGIIGALLFSLAGFFTKERVVQSTKEQSVFDGFKYMFKNKPLLILIISNVLSILGGIGNVLANYYYITVLGYATISLLVGIPGTIVGYVTYAIIPKVKARLSNRQIMILNAFLNAGASLICFLAGIKHYDEIKWVAPILVFKYMVNAYIQSFNFVIPMEMIGDTVDYMEWKTGERNEGISFSVLTFVGKLSGSVSTSIGTALLPLIGYVVVDDVVKTNVGGVNTNFWLWAFFTVIPQMLGLISVIPYFFYNLEGEKLSTIRNEMKLHRQKVSQEVSNGGAINE